MASETVRIHAQTHAKLRQLAEQVGQSMPEVLESAVEAYRRQRFLEGLARDFAALRSDPQAWADEMAERRAWDASLADDLEND
ncbi:MAG: hypothetical protein ACYC35_03585 [Pirellulales bacterium]